MGKTNPKSTIWLLCGAGGKTNSGNYRGSDSSKPVKPGLEKGDIARILTYLEEVQKARSSSYRDVEQPAAVVVVI